MAPYKANFTNKATCHLKINKVCMEHYNPIATIEGIMEPRRVL